ncbi:MAG: chitobiase/beta-hexosaminidase C-terminal domain-containing protein [Candidatus Diapherotrites archaeon]
MKLSEYFFLKFILVVLLINFFGFVNAQTCYGGLSGSSLRDCIGSDESPCHYCDVSDMDYEIRAPDNITTTGWRDMTYSTQVGTCSVSCTQETWTASYLWCPQEGTYSMRTRAYAQGGSGYAWETSDWNTNAYTVNYDYEQIWCTCKGGTWLSGATYCGSLGCQGGKCCGDDGANDNFCVAGGGSCVAGTYYANHCSDGVQNCDEQGVDCGGADCTPCVSVVINNPNGNQYIKGTYNIDFNVYDPNNGELHAKIAYSALPGLFSNTIVSDLNLNNDPNIGALTCDKTNWSTSTRCIYSWDTTTANDGNYYIDMNVWSISGGSSIDSSNASFAIDNTAPTTSASAKKSDDTNYTFGEWSKLNVTVTLECSDETAGCDKTYYCFGSGCNPTTIYSSPITISSEGTTYLRFYSEDNAGNSESVQEKIVKIDKSGPTTTDNAPTTWQISDFNITLSCDDGSGIGCSETYYRINNGAWQPYSEGISITQDGNNRIDYYSNDLLNNIEDTKTCYAPLDKTPPVIDVNSPLANEVIESTIYVRFKVNKGLGSPLDFNSITVLLDGTESDDFIRTEHCIESSGDYICSYYEYVNTAKDYNLSIIVSDEAGWTAQQDINFLYLGHTSFNIEGYIVEPSTPMAGTNYSMMDVGLSLFGGSLCAAAKCIETGFPAIFRNIPPVLVYAGYEEGYFNGDLNIRFYAADYEMGELHTKIAYSTSKGSFQNSIVNDLNLNNYQNIDRLSCASTDWRYAKLCTYEWDTTQASDGNYYLDLNLWDEHGASSSYSTTNTLCIDNIAPDINVINPQPNEIIEDPWVMFKISENGCAPLVLSSISVLLDGEAANFDYVRDCNKSGSEYTCGFNIIGLVERDYNLSIIVSDLATNKRQVDVNFRFIPKISVSAIRPSGTLETGDITISFNVYNTSLSELHAKIYYSSIYAGKLGFENAIETDLNLNNYAQIENLNCTSNAWWPPVQCTYYWDASSVADGNYYIDINIWTNEGLTASGSSLKQFLLDNTPPVASITGVSETVTFEDTIYLNCTDSVSGCKQTRWYYFSDNGVCSSTKDDYTQTTNSNSITITEDNNSYICLWVENNVNLSSKATSSRLNVLSSSWGIVKGPSETINEAALDLNNACSFYVSSDINLACEYQSFVKIRSYDVDIGRVYPLSPSIIESSERPLEVLLESSITSFYDKRYYIIFEGETTRITSQGSEKDYPNVIVRRRTLPLLKANGNLELGTLIIKAGKR